MKIKDYYDAILHYDLALFIEPSNINALQGKDQTYVDLGEHELVAEVHQKIDMIRNNSPIIEELENESKTTIEESKKIPDRIKTVFKRFSYDLISEDEVIKGLKFLIEKGIIKIS